MTDNALPRVALREFGGLVMLVTESGGSKVVISPSRTGRLRTRDPKTGVLREITTDDTALEPFVRAINSHSNLVKALQDCSGCVDAAEAEGLREILEVVRPIGEASPDVARLIDLVERRLMWARTYALEALGNVEAPATSGGTA